MHTQSRTHQAKMKLKDEAKKTRGCAFGARAQQLTSSAFSSRLWVSTRSASVAVDAGGTSGIIIAHP